MSTLSPINIQRQRSTAASYAPAAGLVVAAWALLAAWSLSPYAAWLDHAEMEHIAAPPALRLAIFTLGWTLMVAAMMLPATLLLHRRAHGAPFSLRRAAPLILAYLVVWALFGGASYLADGVLHEVVEQAPAIGRLIAPGLLLVAGVYQLAPPKRFCLSRCRFAAPAFGPLAQLSPWRLWALGLRHGLFCVGSCWALMLLLLAAGGADLFGMLLLALVMAAERLAPRGAYLARLLGVLLILWWAALVFSS